MVNVRLLADLPDALDSAAANTFLYKTAGGIEFQTLEYSDIVGYPTTGIDSAGIISLIDASHLATRDSSSHLDVTNYFDSGVSANIKADSAGTTLNIGNYSKPISNLYLDSASTITIGSHSFSLANNGEVSFFGGSASSYGISSGSSSAVIIENSNYTSFLLKTDSTQTDAQADASGNTTVTEYGNVTSTAITPYNPKGYSLKLDGNDYITPGFNTNFGTGDFTFECWVKTTVGGIIMGQYDNGSQAEAFEINSTNGIIGSHTDSGTEGTYGSQDLRDDKWHHLVWERNNGTYYYYVDGSLQGSASNSENGQQSSGWYIGRFGVANTGYFTGELRDLKFTVGTAVYGGLAPTVPTELTVSGSETFVFATGLAYNKDLSTNGSSRTITEYGDPQYVVGGPYDHVAYSPSSHGGSVYFDGTGDYLQSVIAATDSSDFTYECWVYFTSFGSYGSVFSSAPISGSVTGIVVSTDQWWVGNGSSVTQIVSGNKFKLNRWHHVAVVRESNTVTGYVDGVSVGSVAYSSAISSTTVRLASRYYNDANYLMAGYISDFRYVVGTAVYTAAFTPPTQPLTAISGTQLLTCTNKHDIWDAASGKVLTLNGNTTASTTQSKYASSSIYFDGTGDTISFYPVTGFSDKDFTIEFWWYPTDTSIQALFIGTQGTDHSVAISYGMPNTTTTMGIWASSNGTSWDMVNADNSGNGIGSETVNQNSWNHIAMTRESGTFKLFVNGVLDVTVTGQTGAIADYGSGTYKSVIGQWWQAGTNLTDLHGYIEDFRITTGLARYTSNFTPPTSSLTA